MNDIEQWQDHNNAYLAKALRWIRLLLLQKAEQYQPKQAVEAKRCAWFSRKGQSHPSRAPAKADGETMAQLERDLLEAENGERLPAIAALSQRLGLSRFEQNVVLLCAAMELDPQLADLCCRAQNDVQRNYPTFALAFELFDQPDWGALAATGALRYWRLLDIHQPGPRPLTLSALHLDERILNFLKGVNYLDDRLMAYVEPFAIGGATHLDLPPSQQSVADAILHHRRRQSTSKPQQFQLLGADPISKQAVAGAVAAALGWQLFRVPAELLPPHSVELESLARLWQRESQLLPFSLYMECGADPDAAQVQALRHFVSRFGGPLLIDTRELRPEFAEGSMAFDVAKPTADEQQAVWEAAVSGIEPDDAGRLANQFNLNAAAIGHIAQSALSTHHSYIPDTFGRLWQGCLLHTRPQLDRLAQRIEPKSSWEDLVLPEDTRLLLKQIAEQVSNRHKVYDKWGFRQKMSRGLGISVLFAGASGTGKTMAAEVIANELDLNLYRIDLSAVISKYIGETEKNLRRVFEAAEDGGTLLFFDEADALFGKRSEVKDAHDRFANTQVADLLQRMEAYSGLAILATNMKTAFDPAFFRRLRFIVNFNFPGPAERKMIWQKAFTADAFDPESNDGDLDFDRLAHFNLTGGNIHSIALNAAFLAVQGGEFVSMRHVMQAVRTEFRKLDKPINEAEFRVMELVKGAS